MRSRARDVYRCGSVFLAARAAPALVGCLVWNFLLHTGAVLAGINGTNGTNSNSAALLATITALQNVSLKDNGTKHSGAAPVLNISKQVASHNTTTGNQSATKQQTAAQHNSTRAESRRRVRAKSGNGTRHTRRDGATLATRGAEPPSARHDNTAPSQADQLPAHNQKLPKQQRWQRRMAEDTISLREGNIASETRTFNCSGDYRLAESIDFSRNPVRRSSFPLCRDANFTGSLKTGPYRLENLNVNQGLLTDIEGTCVDLSGFIRATDSGVGAQAGGVTAQARNNNTLTLTDATIIADADADADANATATATATAGGACSELSGHNNTLTLTDAIIIADAYADADTTADARATAIATAGGACGELSGHNNTLTLTGVTIIADADARVELDATATATATAGGVCGLASGTGNTLIQTAVDITATAKRNNANAGSAFGRLTGKDITLRLYSGIAGTAGTAGGMAVCGRIENSAQVHGFVDIAGYNADATNCEQTEGNFTILNTTRRDHWNTVHRQVCSLDHDCQETTCHSPHERLLTLAEGPEQTVYLVSEQRYPFRTEESDGKGLIRISRLERNGSELIPDREFGPHRNGSLLLEVPDGVNRTILRGLPVSQTVNGDYLTGLYSLPDRQQGAFLVRFPLGENSTRAETIELNNLTVTGFPLRLEQGRDGDIIWMLEESDNSREIKRYLLNGTEMTELQSYNLELSRHSAAPIIAAGHDDTHLYTARRVETRIVLERYQLNSGDRDYRWESSVEAPEYSTEGERYDMSVSALPEDDGRLQIELRPLATILASKNGTDSSAMALRISPPKFGGCAEREYFSAEVIIADRFLPLVSNTMAPTNPPPSSCTPLCKGQIGAGLTAGAIATTACTCACCCSKKRKQGGVKISDLKKGRKKSVKKQQKEKRQERVDMELGSPVSLGLTLRMV